MVLALYLDLCLSFMALSNQFFNSVLLVGVAVGTVVSIGVTPFFCGIIYALQEKKLPGKAWVVSTVIAVIGLVLVNSMESANFEVEDVLLPILAGACYSVEISVSKHLTEKHSAEEAMMIITGIVGVGLLPFLPSFPCNGCLRYTVLPLL